MLQSAVLLVTLASMLLLGGFTHPIDTQLGGADTAPIVEATIGETPAVSTNAPVLHVVTADGSRLTNLAAHGLDPAWSPDGAKIAFMRVDAAIPGADVAVIAADGSGLTPLTDSPRLDESPTWSPDGTRIAFNRHTGDLAPDLYVMSADGSALTKLAAIGAPGPPSWSPDGTRLVFAGPGEGGSNIWIVGADGSALEQVTDLVGVTISPTWSPDGTRIAFAGMILGNNGPATNALYVMNSDGTGLTALTRCTLRSALCQPAASPNPNSTAILSAPTWSPDGTRLAFASASALAVIDADGSNLTMLSVDGLNVLEPDWSPNGSQIAFSGWEWDGPNADIYVVHPDGSDLTRVTETEGSDETLAWSPDGCRIAFTLTSQSDE